MDKNDRGRRVLVGTRGGRYVIDEETGAKRYVNSRKRNRSPAARNRSPAARNRSPAARNRSPPARNRSPPARNRSPPARNRSPQARGVINLTSPSPPARSPSVSGNQSFHSARSSPARASPLPQKLMDPLFVDGPHAYARYKLGTGTTIHLFGEAHVLSDRCQPCVYQNGCSTINRLVHDMIKASDRAGEQLDVFIEQIFESQPKVLHTDQAFIKDHRWIPYGSGTRGSSHLTRMRHEFGKLTGPHLRVHSVDMRKFPLNRKDHHPVITNLYFNKPGERSKSKKEIYNIVYTVLMSDTFSDDMKDLGITLNTTQRNLTKFGEKSVSRVRKQLLKLPARIRMSLIVAVLESVESEDYSNDLVYKETRQSHAAMFLMDVAHLARMLYYAGVGGANGPAKPAKAIVSYDGAMHTRKIAKMMEHLIRRGDLDAVIEVDFVDNMNRFNPEQKLKCLSVRMPLNYGFSSPQ